MKFDNYHISDTLKKNLSDQGFRRPTDIQFKAIPSILNNEDVLAVAQTGTGKTAAFAIPLIHRINRAKSSRRSQGIKGLIMVPTRELAAQITDVFNALSRQTRVKTVSVFGGVDQDPQIKRLVKGVDVVVATPGRMFDLISQGAIRLDRLETLVLDEADRMLDLGFINDIKAVKKKIKKKHQTLFFSATINKEIKKLAFSQVKSNAIRIQISPDDPVSKNVSHYVLFVEMDDKRFFLRRFIQDHPDERILVFVRTRVRAERVVKALDRKNIPSLSLHGEKNQEERIQVLENFRQAKTRVLVATDVSARGIDIPGVAYVINYDLPDISENYVHRVGRTGRGTSKGVALSYCSSEEKETLKQVEGFLKKKIEEIPVAKDEYAAVLNPADSIENIRELILEQEDLQAQTGNRARKRAEKKKKRRKK